MDLGWGLAVVAASASGDEIVLFLAYPAVVASLRLGAKEGIAVTLVAIAGWLVLGLAQPGFGAAGEWQAMLLRAASLAVLGYAIARWAAFEAAQKERLRLRAELAADSERRRISLDLHDGAIQPYLGLKLGLEALRRKVATDNPLARDIDELYRMTQDSIAELRGYMRHLDGGSRPGGAALLDGLRRQAERFHGFYGFEVELKFLSEAQPSGPVAAEVVQMVGEGLSNVGRHTASREVTITISSAKGRLEIGIADQGRGVDGAWRPFTPVSLSRRARRLGGGVAVSPRPGGGTMVRIDVPLQ